MNMDGTALLKRWRQYSCVSSTADQQSGDFHFFVMSMVHLLALLYADGIHVRYANGPAVGIPGYRDLLVVERPPTRSVPH